MEVGQQEGSELALENDVPSPRLTEAFGLSGLQFLSKTLEMDRRRADASIKLNRSMGAWVSKKSPANDDDPDGPGHIEGPVNKQICMRARKSKICGKRHEPDVCVASLEQAFLAHIAGFDLESTGTINIEELILILERCSLFDDFFTANKVRNYFITWAQGCNMAHGTGQWNDNGVGFLEFKEVLMWGSDLKCVEFAKCAQKVINLSRKMCDKSSSVQRRLEVVFDAYCKQKAEMMTAFEFGGLCQQVGVYEEDKFTMGDVYSLFYHISGQVHGEGINFEAFIEVIREVSKRVEHDSDEVFEQFAKAVESLDKDDETVRNLKMRLKKAASIVGGNDWRGFFHSCDPDQSGNIDWEEFLVMCREKLHLNDKESHLQILFDKLDEDGSGELEIDFLCAFIAS